jgi:hypothetical protein
MILEYLRKLLFFLHTNDNMESPVAVIKESMTRRSIYQVKLQQPHGLTDRLNFRPAALNGETLEIESLYHPFDPASLTPGQTIDITIYLLPDADHPPGFINCTTSLIEAVSATRLRLALPRHIDRISHNKTDRLQLEPRHAPILAAWCLVKKCDNIRLLKMVNPLILHMPKGFDHERGLIDISPKGACISLDRETYRLHKKDIKTGRDLLLQMAFPGPTGSQRHEFLIVASIRYQRPNLVSGRMELGLQFNHSFSATPKPAWLPCNTEGIAELKWLLQEYKKLYLAEIKTKLSALCDPDSLEAAGAALPDAPADCALSFQAAMNQAALGIFNGCMPQLCNVRLAMQFLRARLPDAEGQEILSNGLEQLEIATMRLENIQETTAGDSSTYETLRPRDIVAQALSFFEHTLAANGIVVERSFQDNLPDIQGDPRQLRLLFKNLLVNALEAMQPHGGRLSLGVSVDIHENDLVIAVEDSGGGIPPEVRARIFQPYQSIPGNGAPGLGLAVAQRIATAHGGRIELFTSLGEGSTFAVRLPLATPVPEARTASEVRP